MPIGDWLLFLTLVINSISLSTTNIYDVPCITDPKIRMDFDLQNVLHSTGRDADLEHSDVMSVAGLMKLFLVGNYGFYSDLSNKDMCLFKQL